MSNKIIMDVDTGIDDALAIAYLLKKEANIIGFTTVFGNVQVDVAHRNTHLILDKLGGDIPVYIGADRPLDQEAPYEVRAQEVHGHDGLANLLSEKEQEMKKEGKDAIDFLIGEIKANPGEISLLFVGPLTNLAHAIERDPSIIDKVKEVIIMGGAVTVPGNVTSYAEANIFADPLAARRVFRSGLKCVLVGLDVTMQTLLPRKRVENWYSTRDKTANFFAEMTDFYIDFYEKHNPGIAGCGLHDPLAAAVLLNRDYVQTKKMRLTVPLDGERKGETSVTSEGPHIEVCFDVKKDAFLADFIETLNF